MGNTFSLFSFFLIVSIDKVLFSNIEMLLIKDGVQFFFFHARFMFDNAKLTFTTLILSFFTRFLSISSLLHLR